jgi:hypothetical protein
LVILRVKYAKYLRTKLKKKDWLSRKRTFVKHTLTLTRGAWLWCLVWLFAVQTMQLPARAPAVRARAEAMLER